MSNHQPKDNKSGDDIEVINSKEMDIEEDVENEEASIAFARKDTGPPHSSFGSRMKAWIIFMVSASALISPFGATTFLPALNVLSNVLHITPSQANISVTTYMIAQAIAPAFIGPMSDSSGRRLSFIICFVIFIVGNIGLALQTSYAALLVLRMVQAVGGTATIALTFAVVADIATSAERGRYMGYAGAGILMGPAFGPTIGGILAQSLGWRSIFWFLAIFTGALLIFFILFFPETSRNVVGDGSILPTGASRSLISCIRQCKLTKLRTSEEETVEFTKPERGRIRFPNPTVTFKILLQKESGIILLYNGLFFTGLMTTITALPALYLEAYGLSELQVGLCYMANGFGALFASLSMGHVVDWNFRRHAKKIGITIVKGTQEDLSNIPIERIRLQIAVPAHIVCIIGLIVFGWAVKYRVHVAVPEVALFVIGFGASTTFNMTSGLLIDLNRDKPAAATAAMNFARCLISAGGSAAILPMCHAMNTGWAFTFLALVYVFLIAVAFWIMRDGMKWRQALEVKRSEKEARKAEEAGRTDAAKS